MGNKEQQNPESEETRQEPQEETVYSKDPILVVFQGGKIIRAESPPGTALSGGCRVTRCPNNPNCMCYCCPGICWPLPCASEEEQYKISGDIRWPEEALLLVFENGEVVRAESPPGTPVNSGVTRCPGKPNCWCYCTDDGRCWELYCDS